MSTAVTIFGAVIIGLSIIMLAAFGYISLQFLLFFHWRKCKHCNHNMDYRGFKDDDDNGHYLFHCPECGAWDQVPREEFFRQCDNPVDEN